MDGTGPTEQGPLTGAGRGKCEGTAQTGGYGRGMGMGRSFCRFGQEGQKKILREEKEIK